MKLKIKIQKISEIKSCFFENNKTGKSLARLSKRK